MIKNIKYINKISVFLFYSAVFFVIAFGLYLRIKLYLRNDLFWDDEISLCLNLANKNIKELFSPLFFGQLCPPLYMVMSYLVYKIFGADTFALRFPSLLAGCLSLILFFPLLNKFFKSKLTVLTGMILFCVSPPVVYYASEFKPYSFDLLFSVILLFFFDKIKVKSIKHIVLYSLSAPCLYLFSHTSGIILTVIFLIKILFEKDIKIKFNYIFPVITLLIAFLYQYSVFFAVKKFMIDYWGNYFIEISPVSFYKIFYGLFSYFFTQNCSANIIFIIFIAGIFTMLYSKKHREILVISILTASMLLSFLKIYPLGLRLALYIFPVILFIILYLIDTDFTDFKKKPFIKPLIILFLLFIPFNIINTVKVVTKPDFFIRVPADSRTVRHEAAALILNNRADEEIIISAVHLSPYLYFKNKFENHIKFDDKNLMPYIYENDLPESKGFWISNYQYDSEHSNISKTVKKFTENKKIKYEEYVIRKNNHKINIYHIYDKNKAKDKPEFILHEIVID